MDRTWPSSPLNILVLTCSGSQLFRAGQEGDKQQESIAYQYNSRGQIPEDTRLLGQPEEVKTSQKSELFKY